MSQHTLTAAALVGLCCSLLLLAHPALASSYPAHIKNVGGQLTTSSTLRWQPYRGDDALFENAVIAGHIQPPPPMDASDADAAAALPPTPMYVCRAQIDGIPVCGHTQHAAGRWLCIVSMHMVVYRPHAFDLLLNVRNGAMLVWQPWSKFIANTPLGAVSASSASHVSGSSLLALNTPTIIIKNHNSNTDYLRSIVRP